MDNLVRVIQENPTILMIDLQYNEIKLESARKILEAITAQENEMEGKKRHTKVDFTDRFDDPIFTKEVTDLYKTIKIKKGKKGKGGKSKSPKKKK